MNNTIKKQTNSFIASIFILVALNMMASSMAYIELLQSLDQFINLTDNIGRFLEGSKLVIIFSPFYLLVPLVIAMLSDITGCKKWLLPIIFIKFSVYMIIFLVGYFSVLWTTFIALLLLTIDACIIVLIMTMVVNRLSGLSKLVTLTLIFSAIVSFSVFIARQLLLLENNVWLHPPIGSYLYFQIVVFFIALFWLSETIKQPDRKITAEKLMLNFMRVLSNPRLLIRLSALLIFGFVYGLYQYLSATLIPTVEIVAAYLKIDLYAQPLLALLAMIAIWASINIVLLSPLWLKRVTIIKLLVFYLFVIITALIMYFLMPIPPIEWLVYLPLVTMITVITALLVAVITDAAKYTYQGLTIGIIHVGHILAWVLGTLVGNSLAALHYMLPLWIAILLIIVLITILWRIRPSYK